MATGKRRKAPPRAPKYHRLTEGKRIIIKTLRKEGLPPRCASGNGEGALPVAVLSEALRSPEDTAKGNAPPWDAASEP